MNLQYLPQYRHFHLIHDRNAHPKLDFDPFAQHLDCKSPQETKRIFQHHKIYTKVQINLKQDMESSPIHHITQPLKRTPQQSMKTRQNKNIHDSKNLPQNDQINSNMQ